MREPESCAGQRLRAKDGQRPESRAAGVGAPIGSRRLHGDDGLARIGSQSLFFFFFRQPGPVGYAVRFARRRGGPASAWLVGGLWMRAAHGPTAAPAAEGTPTHPPSHLVTLSLPPLPLLPLRPGPGAAAWNGSLGPALQFSDPVLRTTVHVRSAGPDDSSHSAQGEPRGQFPSHRLSAARQCWWARNADQRCSGR